MSPTKILIAYDASEPSGAIFGDLLRAGLPEHADVVVISCADVPQPGPAHNALVANGNEPEADTGTPAESFAQYREAQCAATDAGDRIRAMFPGWRVESLALADSAAAGILKTADEWEPDLIVVGSHGRSCIGRMIHGSVSQRVLAEAGCSVRIARGGLGPATGGVRIVLGFDGSVESLAAVHSIAARRWPAGSTVCIVSAYGLNTRTDDPYQSPNPDPPVIITDNLTIAAIQHITTPIVRELVYAGIEATSIIRKGRPDSVILDLAEQWGADSIFLGAPGHPLLDRILAGSVSDAVAMNAKCSVEITRVGLA